MTWWRARAPKELTPADLRGRTFTLSNHGTSGSLLAAPIVINGNRPFSASASWKSVRR